MDAVDKGNLDDGDWELADFESTSGGTVDGRASAICESFHHIQQTSQDAGIKVPQILLELLSCMAEMPILVPSQAITPN